MTETELMRGYRACEQPSVEPLRAVRCLCGGTLVAPPNDDARIRFVVEQHKTTPRHQAWWAEASWV